MRERKACQHKKHSLIVFVIAACLAFTAVAWADDYDEAMQWYQRGLALSDNSETEASCYRKALELYPDFFKAHNRLGEVYEAWGEYESAIAEFKRASEDPLYADPRNNLGQIYRRQGKYDLAAEELNKAIAIEPDYPEAQNQLRYVYRRMGEFDHPVEAGRGFIPGGIFARIPGMTIPEGSFLIDFQYEFWNQTADVTEDLFVKNTPPLRMSVSEREMSVHTWILGIRYGLTRDFTVGLLPKFHLKKADLSAQFGNIHAEPSVSGFGDTVLLTKYRLWGSKRTHVSAYHLLSIPTGDEDAEGKDGEFRRTIPLGSGSFDFTPGIAFSTTRGLLAMQANLSYTITDGRQAGDELKLDLGVAYPFFDRIAPTLELNYRWRDSARRRVKYVLQAGQPPVIGFPTYSTDGGPVAAEATVEEKGGHTLFLSPGIKVDLPAGFEAELGVQIPLVKPSDKEAWIEDFVLHIGLANYFF
jgi:hypothetical protein